MTVRRRSLNILRWPCSGSNAANQKGAEAAARSASIHPILPPKSILDTILSSLAQIKSAGVAVQQG